MLIRFTLMIVLLSFPHLSALAKTLYVDGENGDDSVSYAQNAAERPWRTIGRAAWGSTDRSNPSPPEAARAGDEVLIASGIYWETGHPTGGRTTVSLNPVNEGSAGNPIIFRGEGSVFIRMLPGFRGGMIGCNNRSYIIWDNFQIDDYYGGSTSDTGPVIFSGNATHCQLINSDIKGHSGSYYHGYPTFVNNYRGISIEPAHHIVIRNNTIHNFRGGENEAGIMAYDSNDNIIENNELYDNAQGIFIKGVHEGKTQARNIIRYNVVRNNSYGAIRVLSAQDTYVYQNLIINNGDMGLRAGFFDSTRSRFVNNTLINNARAFVPQGEDLVDVLFHGNILVGNTDAIHNWNSTPARQDVRYDYNVYFNNNNHAVFPAGRYSFGAWQSTWGHDQNGAMHDPQFVDAENGDFRLQPSSPSRSISVDILDLSRDGSTTDFIPAGAYITGDEIIGPMAGSSFLASPRPPSGLTVE